MLLTPPVRDLCEGDRIYRSVEDHFEKLGKDLMIANFGNPNKLPLAITKMLVDAYKWGFNRALNGCEH